MNIPLDSHTLIDTDYIEDYLRELPDLLPFIDVDDPRFDDVVDRIIDSAVDGNRFRNRLRDAVCSSDLWERITDLVDDVLIDFIHEEVPKLEAEFAEVPTISSAKAAQKARPQSARAEDGIRQ